LKLFGKKNEQTISGIKMITESGNGFYTWNKDLYKSDIIRSCIRPTAKAIGKLEGQHLRQEKEGLKINPEVYIRFLLEEPNPYMTGQIMQEKMANQLELNNNAFAILVRDENGLAQQAYPISCVGVETTYPKGDELYLKFTLKNGKILERSYSDIIHLRQDFNDDELFGTSNATALSSLMEVVTTTDQGIVKAIKNSNIIRWLLKFKSVLKQEDIDKQLETFVKNYLSIDSDSVGAAATDPRYDVEQVKPESFVPNAAQMDRTTTRLYNFFGTNDKIIQNKTNEDEWNAYYEAKIEPIAKQLSQEFTRKIFTRKARGFGNKILYSATSLQYASMSNKLNLFQMVDRGSLVPNEWRAILNLGPIEGGDKPIRRLDTAPIDQEMIDKLNKLEDTLNKMSLNGGTDNV